ncbi:hypothetical protein F8M41_001078 [Gigaspora margarita]|uniref:Uncharacterized protein n=1 Tax=Gigaspora margarita TaxID=4874 RepID=A0A8H4A8C5_GIGMA|nr:hypothetical protein F8M41_001078 [Gigaspora margarita]
MLGSSNRFNHFGSSSIEYGDSGLLSFVILALIVDFIILVPLLVISTFAVLVVLEPLLVVTLEPLLVMTLGFVIIGMLGLCHFVDIVCRGFVGFIGK